MEEQALQLIEAVAVFKIAAHSPITQGLSAIADAPAQVRAVLS
ncbi:hypothetical protein [Xanthomonas arboricola]